MEKYKEVIPIFFAVDDGYIPFLAVTLQSIVEKSQKEYYRLLQVRGRRSKLLLCNPEKI